LLSPLPCFWQSLYLTHSRPLLGLLQGKSNLLLGKSGPLHRENPSCSDFSSWQNFLMINGPVFGEQAMRKTHFP
jgi:hypothetical protein